jgi:hypothetical protein
MRSARDE